MKQTKGTSTVWNENKMLYTFFLYTALFGGGLRYKKNNHNPQEQQKPKFEN